MKAKAKKKSPSQQQKNWDFDPKDEIREDPTTSIGAFQEKSKCKKKKPKPQGMHERRPDSRQTS